MGAYKEHMENVLTKRQKAADSSGPTPNGLAADRKVVGVAGKWYDVTTFVDRHPGGDVLKYFLNKDATDVFRSSHPVSGVSEKYLKSLKVVGTYKYDFDADPFNQDMRGLYERLLKEGYYKTNLWWYARKVAVCGLIFAAMLWLVVGFQQTWVHCLAGVLLAIFWQQIGFMMHDLMHHQIFETQKVTNLVGTFVGSVCFGVSANWWRDEHWVHHMLTNTICYKTDFQDPQVFEPTWAQNVMLFPLMKTKFQAFLVQIQHIIFIPACMIGGRLDAIIGSYKEEKEFRQYIAFGLHWMWMCALLSLLPNWEERAVFYAIAAFGEGLLHIQILINHYAKDIFLKDELHQMEFYRYQTEQNINISNPWWMDWFHGGLNFHIEHHCFPRVPRHNLRKVGDMIQEICRKHNVPYDSSPFTTVIWRTLNTLYNMKFLFKLDPR
ncbi:uncharacterized protein [Branchiostoma lanceolatum]|uniref:uncharacterized protein n=1 Tax=Branchiostoma lanceolatum TaxID=7740 RepID=UPI001132A4B3